MSDDSTFLSDLFKEWRCEQLGPANAFFARHRKLKIRISIITAGELLLMFEDYHQTLVWAIAVSNLLFISYRMQDVPTSKKQAPVRKLLNFDFDRVRRNLVHLHQNQIALLEVPFLGQWYHRRWRFLVFKYLHPHKYREAKYGKRTAIMAPIEALVMQLGRVEPDKITNRKDLITTVRIN